MKNSNNTEVCDGFVPLSANVYNAYSEGIFGASNDAEFAVVEQVEDTKNNFLNSNSLNDVINHSNTVSKRTNLKNTYDEFSKDIIESSTDTSLDNEKNKSLFSREDNYRKQRLNRMLSPQRSDPFSDSTPDPDVRTYSDIMLEQQLDKEKNEVLKLIRKKQEVDAAEHSKPSDSCVSTDLKSLKVVEEKKRRRWDVNDSLNKKTRNEEKANHSISSDKLSNSLLSDHNREIESTSFENCPTPNVWEDTPTIFPDMSSKFDSTKFSSNDLSGETPFTSDQSAVTPIPRKNRWDSVGPKLSDSGSTNFEETPITNYWGDTPIISSDSKQSFGIDGDRSEGVGDKKSRRKASRWDATPVDPALNSASSNSGTPTPISSSFISGNSGGITNMVTPLAFGEFTPKTGEISAQGVTPMCVLLNNNEKMQFPSGATPSIFTPNTSSITPFGFTGLQMVTPITPIDGIFGSDKLLQMRMQNENEERNRFLSDEELDVLLPLEGYEIVKPSSEYAAVNSLHQKRSSDPKNIASGMGSSLGNNLKGLSGETLPSTPSSSFLFSTNIVSSGVSGGNSSLITPVTTSSATPLYNIPEDSLLRGKYGTNTGQFQNDLDIINPSGADSLQNTFFNSLYSNPDKQHIISSLISLTPQEMNEIHMKPEDYQYFGKLFFFNNKASSEASSTSGSINDFSYDFSRDEINERKILALLLKIKNGTPPIRRNALRTITEKAKEFGAGALFNQILPLMMVSSLEDQERHLLVKVIDRILYKLEEDVRPYVHKILVVIEPLLIDEDYYARVEGREIISSLSKAAGLATMIATMRPDIDHQDEYVRNTTARAFAVVASALGIPSLLLFLRAVCQSKKSWQARHTGVKIIQQIAILMGCGVLPHLKQLVEIIADGLQDEQTKVRTITALALAALAEASAPYGIEAFDCVLRNLWKGITEHRGKGLAAFLKAIGLIIPLMDSHHANYYTREVMGILINEFGTQDEEMKKIVLKVVKQCIATEGVEADYIKNEILPHFFNKFWIVRNSLDRRNAKQLVETTVEIANKVGASEILLRIVEDLKDSNESYRKMILDCIQQIVQNLGVLDINLRLEEQLIDGILYAFQEQSGEDNSLMLNAFSTVVNALHLRVKPYLPQIAGIIRWRLNTPNARVRQQAADLISRIAIAMKACDEEQMLCHLGLFLYEYLGEEYPEVLGSILGALKAIVNVIGMEKMSPPIKDLLPRLTPIMKNRHEKVQENVINLIGRIADRGGDLVSPKEWDRICFDLLELLKAHKKNIRRATVNTFGYIARAIGPFDVLNTLLSNLRVQERQLRVCTTVAIAIVAETCLPYTVLPALMNEYRVQELNVQNGVLKTISFMFEYVGEISKDYIYAVLPLLEDALTDRDLVHRQTASWASKHLALGVHGLGCEDALQNLLNLVWPNILETSPHLIQSVFDALDAFRVSLGPSVLLYYLLQGLFHPSRKVREVYWRIYNNVYIGHQDALVAFFPEFENDYKYKNIYTRHELYLTV